MKILIVEDERELAKSMVQYLRQESYVCETAYTAQEALEKISKINPDLIVMAGDIFHKPRPSNFTIYATIKLLQKFRQNCNSPIIMISGNHETVKGKLKGARTPVSTFNDGVTTKNTTHRFAMNLGVGGHNSGKAHYATA